MVDTGAASNTTLLKASGPVTESRIYQNLKILVERYDLDKGRGTDSTNSQNTKRIAEALRELENQNYYSERLRLRAQASSVNFFQKKK